MSSEGRRKDRLVKELESLAARLEVPLTSAGVYQVFKEPILRLDAPAGTYRVDAILTEPAVLQGTLRIKELSDLRLEVSIAAAHAVHHSYELLVVGARAHKNAQALMALLEELLPRLALLQKLAENTPIYAYLGPYDPSDQKNSAAANAVAWLLNHTEIYKEAVENVISTFTVVKRESPGRADPLVEFFIDFLMLAWARMTEKFPSRSRSSPFVRFLAAAWADVEFPIPKKLRGIEFQDPLEDWLGGRVDNHPYFKHQATLKKRNIQSRST